VRHPSPLDYCVNKKFRLIVNNILPMLLRLSCHSRLRQEHPLRLRGEKQVERTLQTWISLRGTFTTGRQKPSFGKLSWLNSFSNIGEKFNGPQFFNQFFNKAYFHLHLGSSINDVTQFWIPFDTAPPTSHFLIILWLVVENS
jgi:hypothetical protein